MVGNIKAKKLPQNVLPNYFFSPVLLFSHSVTLYSASPHLFIHSISFLAQSFCLLSLSSSPTLSKWSAAEFIICSGNGVFWLMTWPLGPILPGKNQRVGACLWMHVCHYVCILVFLPLWEPAGVLEFWSDDIFGQSPTTLYQLAHEVKIRIRFNYRFKVKHVIESKDLGLWTKYKNERSSQI